MTEGDALKASLDSRSTEELTAILARHDEEEWRPEVFALVETVLRARGAPIPVASGAYSEDVVEDQPLVTVGKYFAAIEAHGARSMLDSAGIEAWVADESLGTVYCVGVGVRLRVRAEDESSARELLHAAEISPAQLPSELSAPPCPSCGAAGASQTSELLEGPDSLGGKAKLNRYWFYQCAACGNRWPDEGE